MKKKLLDPLSASIIIKKTSTIISLDVCFEQSLHFLNLRDGYLFQLVDFHFKHSIMSHELC